MWQQIKDWCWTDKIETVPFTLEDTAKGVADAMAHYCEVCDRGFTTAHGCKNHKRIKHGE
jgi:hypothetical protein